MGNSSSITEDRVSGPVGPVDYGKLHAYVSNLLMDSAALSAHCRELWDDVHGVVLPQEELQPVTQRLIDSLGCRHPSSLERIGAVYSTFAHREGLSLLEFQGYVACVLTQILRELEARSTGSVESLEADDSDSATAAPRAPFAVTLAESKEPVQDPQESQESQDALEELSELQRLTQELTSLNTSLARLEAPVEAPVAEPPLPAAEAEPAAEPAPAEAPEAREMATLLTTLEDLNRSLGQLDSAHSMNSVNGVNPTQNVQMAAEIQSQQMQQMQQMQMQIQPKAGSLSGSRSHNCARQPQAGQAEKAHHLEQVFPQQPRVPHPAHPAHPAAHAAPVAIGAAIDPGNTYARALRGGVHEMAGEVRPWTRLDVEASQEAATAGEPQPEEALRPMANSWLNSRLNGASKGLAHSWQAFAETMDSIFVPEARFGQAPEATPQPEMPEMPEVPPNAQPVEEDVPAIFRQPTVEEVQEVLEQEGLPAYVAIASAGTFCAKKLCLDSSSSPHLYVLEPDSSIPAVFFGMQGFCLEDLRRIVLSEAPLDSTSKPLLSLEFDDGFLPVRLGSALVLRGLVGVLCHGRNVQIMQQSA